MRREIIVVGLLFGCGDPPAESQPATPFGQVDPQIHFLVDPRPQDEGGHWEEAASAIYGDPIRVVVDGLPPGAEITLVSTSAGYRSEADFEADGDGTVDLARDAPIRGTWSSADADGFLWSMEEVNATATGDYSITVQVVASDVVVTEATLERLSLEHGIQFDWVQSGRTVGAICSPLEIDAPLPAILAFGGSEGGTFTGVFDCAYWAHRGFTVLGIGYFGEAGLPEELERVPLELLREGLDYLAADPRVDPDRIAVMGGSRGGELALLLGATFPEVKAVVAVVPSGIVYGGLADPTVAAWTFEGEDIPHLQWYGGEAEVEVDEYGTWHVKDSPAYLADLETAPPEEVDAATIRAEQTRGPVLFLGGGDDQLWPSCTLGDIAYQRLVASGHTQTYDDRFFCFEDAGHSLATTPGWSTMTSTEYYIGSNTYLVTGGTPEANARAQREADIATRQFLEDVLVAP